MPPLGLIAVRRALALAPSVLVLALALVGPASAASPSPSAGPSPSPSASDEPHHISHIEAWLDTPLPADAAADSTIDVGVTIVDRDETGASRLSQTQPSYLALAPASGTAKPSRAPTRSDWPGHVRATVVVPVGGPGAIEVGFHGQECHEDGTCQEVDIPFASGGVGPPPDLSRAALVTATVDPPAEPPVVGRPVALEVQVVPRARWEVSELALPARMLLLVREQRGQDATQTEIVRTGAPGSPYRGSVTIPKPGDYAMVVALIGTPGSPDEEIGGPTSRLTVEADGPPPAAAQPDGAGDMPPWPWIAGLGAIAIVAGYAIRRAFADL